MTNKHTPGPWDIAKIDGGAGDDEIVAEVGGCIVNICAVFGEGDYETDKEFSYKVSKEESESNARLIAAAPEQNSALIESASAIEDAYEDIYKMLPDGPIPGWFIRLEAAAKQNRAAIAKATGN